MSFERTIENEDLSFVLSVFYSVANFKKAVEDVYRAADYKPKTNSFYSSILSGTYNSIRGDAEDWKKWKKAIDSEVNEIKKRESSGKFEKKEKKLNLEEAKNEIGKKTMEQGMSRKKIVELARKAEEEEEERTGVSSKEFNQK